MTLTFLSMRTRILTALVPRVKCSACAASLKQSIVMEKVVLVCLHNRAREVRVCESDDSGDVVASLERAVRERFSDLPNLCPTSQLIFQVCIKYGCLN